MTATFPISEMAREELVSLREQAEAELERRRFDEVGSRPANVVAAECDLELLGRIWHDDYQGDILPDD